MPDPIVRYSLEQFALLLAAYKPGRRINAVHLHHTWRPNHSQWRGQASVEAMRRFHMEENHWSDIAQHLTLDPAGGLWSGRPWTKAPASSAGANGTADEGPFMIEMVGDFDLGKDVFEGEQKATMLGVVARLVIHFDLDPGDPDLKKAVRFHRELNQGKKTCPGTSLDLDATRGEIAAEVARLRAEAAAVPRGRRAPRAAAPAPDVRLLAGSAALVAPAESRSLEGSGEELGEVPESPRALARQLAEAARLEADPTGSRSRGAKPGSPFAPLEPYVINLTNGRLSQSGDFTTDLVEDLEEIFDFHLPAYCRVAESQGRIPRMMIHAHGGLNNEKAALRYALSVHRWWLQLGVYPLYFLWETGFLESFQQRALAEPGTRDFFDHTTDPAFEHLTAGLGGAAWRRMKDNAERCSSPDLGDGVRGGAFLFAERLARFLADGQSLEIHAVGHSAGAVFHAHFLSLLAGVLSVPVATYSLLAPAARVELFKAKTLPLAQAGKIGKLALFSMDKQHEKADSVGGIYRKSLLYLVSRAFEGGEVTPLVGLQEDVLRDPQLVAAFVAPTGEVHWSPSPVSESPRLTLATAHGDFDNDAATMESVARRVLGMSDGLSLAFPFPEKAAKAPDPDALAGRAASSKKALPPNPSGGGRRALCVGVDRYPGQPLAGCVNDAKMWGEALSGVGFEVRYLLDGEATRERLVASLEGLVAGAQAGDVLVFQYAGHGTQLDDLNGDEADHLDEAFVPIDYQSGAFLLDDDIALLTAKLPAGVNFTFFTDCCHSGTITRALLSAARPAHGEKVRYLQPTAELNAKHRAFRAGTRALPMPGGGLAEAEKRVIHFAACLDPEFAYEQDGHGEFTLKTAPLVAGAAQRGDTSLEFKLQILERFAGNSRQHPDLQCPPALERQPLLAPLVSASAPPAGAGPGPESEAELRAELARLEAEVARLRERLGRG